MCMASLTQHNVFRVHPLCSMDYHQFIVFLPEQYSSYGYTIFFTHSSMVTNCHIFGYCEERCFKHLCIILVQRTILNAFRYMTRKNILNDNFMFKILRNYNYFPQWLSLFWFSTSNKWEFYFHLLLPNIYLLPNIF